VGQDRELEEIEDNKVIIIGENWERGLKKAE